ncbi:MAG TPA: serine hydrolase [Isosphaeraceae bacterium]
MFSRIAIILPPLLSLLGPVAHAGSGDSLDARLRPIIDAFEGKVAIAVKHLGTGEAFLWHENDVMSTASLIKFPVMVEAYRQAGDKKVDLAKTLTLKKTDKVPGSGILTDHFSDGATFPLVDAIHLMIVYSDNTATNLVLEEIGIPSTAKTMETLGYPSTKIHSKVFRRDTSVFPERSKQYGLGSTTAMEMLRLCEALEKKELVSKEASEAMLKHMLACDDKDKFPRHLPEGAKVAFKTGSVGGTRTAAGILYTKRGPVAVCVLTDGHKDGRYVPDNAGNRFCADVAKALYDYYTPEPQKEEAKPPAS